MDAAKKKRLEAAGYQFMNAEDFLDLTEAERQAVDLRVTLARVLRERRTARGLTQKALADLMESSQSRVAKMEAAVSSVSLDLLFRGLFILGGGLKDLATVPARKAKPARTSGKASAKLKADERKRGAKPSARKKVAAPSPGD